MNFENKHDAVFGSSSADVVGPEFPMYGCSNCDEEFKVTLAGIKL